MNSESNISELRRPFTLGIMQPYFFPYIGYFQLIAAVDRLVLYDSCQYIKGGWVNRNRLLQFKGEDFYITVPLKRHSYKILISEACIYNGFNWHEKILLSIRQNYTRAPYFREVYPVLENLFACSYDSISHLNIISITEICRLLDIRTELIPSLDRYRSVEESVKRGQYACKPMVKRVISICQMEGADNYINAIGGQELYQKETFTQNGINLGFLRTNEISYKQMNRRFCPNLSIIDVLMNVGVEATKTLLKEYQVV